MSYGILYNLLLLQTTMYSDWFLNKRMRNSFSRTKAFWISISITTQRKSIFFIQNQCSLLIFVIAPFDISPHTIYAAEVHDDCGLNILISQNLFNIDGKMIVHALVNLQVASRGEGKKGRMLHETRPLVYCFWLTSTLRYRSFPHCYQIQARKLNLKGFMFLSVDGYACNIEVFLDHRMLSCFIWPS